MEKTDLCYLYDSAYSKSGSTILHEVGRDVLSNRDIGYLCRYACEYYLRWGPEEAIQKLSDPVLRMMKLDNLVEGMRLPPEISPPEKRIYLYTLMYSEYLGKIPKAFFVTAIYQSVLMGRRKEIPHGFFSGGYGAEQNARICLMYALQVFAGCRTSGECVRFMESRQAVPFLREAKLYYIMKRRYRSPGAYVNDALALVGMLDQDSLCTGYRERFVSPKSRDGTSRAGIQARENASVLPEKMAGAGYSREEPSEIMKKRGSSAGTAVFRHSGMQ